MWQPVPPTGIARGWSASSFSSACSRSGRSRSPRPAGSTVRVRQRPDRARHGCRRRCVLRRDPGRDAIPRRRPGHGPPACRRIPRDRGRDVRVRGRPGAPGRAARHHGELGRDRGVPLRRGPDRLRTVREQEDRATRARARATVALVARRAVGDLVRRAASSGSISARTGSRARPGRRVSSSPTGCSRCSRSSRPSGSGSATGASAAISTAGWRSRSPSSSSPTSTTCSRRCGRASTCSRATSCASSLTASSSSASGARSTRRSSAAPSPRSAPASRATSTTASRSTSSRSPPR